MIGAEGQYVFRFDVGGYDDFIAEQNFISFTLVEEAGGLLPTFQLAFRLQDDVVLTKLNETNNLKVIFGKDSLSVTDASLTITKLTVQRQGNARLVNCIGTFAAIEYLNKSRAIISGASSAFEVLHERASLYFHTEFNRTSGADSQRWISPGWSDKRFFSELWMHSDFGASFPLIAITSDGTFRGFDVKRKLAQGIDWRITRDPVNANDLTYNDDAIQQSNSGFMNAWMGYGRKQQEFDLEAGTNEEISAIPEPVLALTKKLSRRADVEAKQASSGIVNDNVHANYWRSHLYNMTNIASLSTLTVTLSYSNRFYPMKVLDTIIFKDDDVLGRNKSSEFNSGVYFISKIARTIMHRQIKTTLTLSRESFNQME